MDVRCGAGQQEMQAIIGGIDKESSISHDRFFKENEIVKTHGLKSADVHRIAKTYFQRIKE